MTAREPTPAEDLDYLTDRECWDEAAALAIEHVAVLNPMPLDFLNERQFHGLDRALRRVGWEIAVRDGQLWIEDASVATEVA